MVLIATRYPMLLGGDDHTGWLPAGAALPRPTPERIVEIDVSLEFDGSGYVLEWCPSPGQDAGNQAPFAGDLWYPSLISAFEGLRQTFAIDRRYTWQKTDGAPIVVRNGLERPYEGTMSALVSECQTVTLVTTDGLEVEVRRLRRATDGVWEGVVQRAAAGRDSPRIGTYVYFQETEVHAATL